jgi:WD40 repeat protein
MIRAFQYGVSGGSSFQINATKEVLLAPFDVKKGDVFHRFQEFLLNKIANPATLPRGTGNGCAFSPDGDYFAVAHSTAPYITLYDWNDGAPVKLPDPAILPTGAGYGCAFSPDGNYFAVGHPNTPYIILYDWNDGAPVKLPDPATYPRGIGNGCAFSSDGNYFAVAHPYNPYITLYDFSINEFYSKEEIHNLRYLFSAETLISTSSGVEASEIEAYVIPII